MGMSVKDRIRFNKRRFDIRHYLSVKNAVIISSICVVIFLSVSSVGAYLLKKKVSRSTVVYKGEDIANAQEKVEAGSSQNTANDESVLALMNEDETKSSNDNNLVKKENTELTLCLLGEIMMGGEVTKNVNYMYSSAFKNIYTDTKSADFTYANFSTNITNLDKIEDAKSKYLVNKEIFSAIRALGLDSVSIASDHITDYPSDIIKNTISKLEENEIFVAGRKDTPVYFEKDGKKIAIVSTNSVIIGTSKNYSKEDISVYNKDNLIKNIKEAKESADIVIADIHWGKDYSFSVTDQMRNIAMSAVDAGADMVMGSHAAGIYPMITYKEKPIIYSTGYLIGDSDLYVSKESFIFDLTISNDKKIDKITMTPIYINDKKEVLKYNEYDSDKSSSYLNQYNTWQKENGLDSNIQDGKIVVKF